MQLVVKKNTFQRSIFLHLMNRIKRIKMIHYLKTLMKEKLMNNANFLKNNEEPVIPLNIFQTWSSKKMPLRMLRNIVSIKNSNPEFNYYFFDDNDCETFIEKNFPPNVLKSFQTLIPGAYKADLWRYCILYKLGGIYIDIKYHTLRPFRLIQLTKQEHWVLDADGDGIYNALIVCKPGNPLLLKAIHDIVENVNNRFYGNSCLDPTGPSLLRKYFTHEEKKNFSLKHKFISNTNNRYILWNNIPIMRSYKGYLEDCKNSKMEHYGILWNKRSIYK